MENIKQKKPKKPIEKRKEKKKSYPKNIYT